MSTITGRDDPYAVVLPPGCDAHPTSRYPDVYLLHAYGRQPTNSSPLWGPSRLA